MQLTKTLETPDDIYFETSSSRAEFVGRIEELIALRKAENRSPFYYFKNFSRLIKEVNYFEFRVREGYIYKTSGLNCPPLYIYTETKDNKTTVHFHLTYFRYMRWALYLIIIFFGYSIFEAWSSDLKFIMIIMGVVICLLVGAAAWGIEQYNSYKFKKFAELLLKDLQSKV